jgi:acyl-lipid omega-6 desaturase (Delta-12 desaturase)
MIEETDKIPDDLTIHSLRKLLSPYAKPDFRQAILQLINTFVPYVALWLILVFMVEQKFPFVWTFLLIFIASLFLVRIFIFFHDCAHGSFFASRKANTILGYVSGVLTFTPFTYWQHNHLVHHGTYADLDHRGVGDIWTLTVEEYQAASRMMQLAYRLYRDPIIFPGIGPGYSFLITHRFLHRWKGKNGRTSAAFIKLAILTIVFKLQAATRS